MSVWRLRSFPSGSDRLAAEQDLPDLDEADLASALGLEREWLGVGSVAVDEALARWIEERFAAKLDRASFDYFLDCDASQAARPAPAAKRSA
jgi:hypothetical protein